MRITSALDSVFASQPEEEFDHPYDSEEEWNRDYKKSQWPSGQRHMHGQVRVGGPDLEDHPDYDLMYNEGWRPSRTRDAFVHPRGRILTYGESSEYSPRYPNGRKTHWFEQAIGEGAVHYRDHERLADALSATKWDGEFPTADYPQDEKKIDQDVKWLKEDRGR